MAKRNAEKYEYSLLREYFFLGMDSNEEWRVFHAKDRGLKNRNGIVTRAGSLADRGISNCGYRYCVLPKRGDKPQCTLLAHIVVWVLWNRKNVPAEMEIDHRNRVKTDNHPEFNLRLMDHRGNCMNSSRYDDRPIGIYEHRTRPKTNKRFVARVMDRTLHRRVSLGIYFTRAEAEQAVASYE